MSSKFTSLIKISKNIYGNNLKVILITGLLFLAGNLNLHSVPIQDSLQTKTKAKSEKSPKARQKADLKNNQNEIISDTTNLTPEKLKSQAEKFFAEGDYKLSSEYYNKILKLYEKSILELKNKSDLLQSRLESEIQDQQQFSEKQSSTNPTVIGLSVLIVLVITGIFLYRKKQAAVFMNEFHDTNNSDLLDNNKYEELNSIINSQKEELASLNITKDKFFSIIAHDLKNPLSSMINLSGLLTDPYNELTIEEISEYSKDLHYSSKNLYNLLDNLLTWSNCQRGTIKFSPEPVDFSEMTTFMKYTLAPLADAKYIPIINDVPEHLQIICDRDMINTVIRNLTTNAIKYSHEGGEVTISARQNTDDTGKPVIEVSVSDTGVGMSSEDINKLFRIDLNHTKIGTSQEKGTGLGLILCHEFVKKHGGRIWAESEVGRGTSFHFTIGDSREL